MARNRVFRSVLLAAGVLLIAAFSVAGAVFLILELDGPFDGVIKISSGPMRFALSQLGGQ